MEVNIIMAQRFILNGTSYHGKGAIKEIATEAISRGFKKAFVCSDPDLIKFGVTKKVLDVLDENGLAYEVYSDIKPNPTVENVKTGVQAFKDAGTDYLIAIGGGSSMDTAKAIGIIINNPEFSDVISLEGVAPTKKPCVPIIAVPTTAGTAAEVTINYAFTITEKGYSYNDADLARGLDAVFAMGKLTALLYERYKAGKLPLTLQSTDNCSHNGDHVKAGVKAYAERWVKDGIVEAGFLDYINDSSKITYPWSMIDKITPRPHEKVQAMLAEDGFEDNNTIITKKHTFTAPFVNAEEVQYLVCEDTYTNGRPPLELGGALYTSRKTVDEVETMKVTTCLNPLHTAMSIYGCMLDYTLISAEMADEDLRAFIQKIGYIEAMPVVTDPGVLNPYEFIGTVINKRLPNPFMPDAPQRIATDTSQKLSIRFGETIKKYIDRGLDKSNLVLIPLVLAGYARYLKALDDNLKPFEPSSDPLLAELQAIVAPLEVGKADQDYSCLKNLYSRKDVFGLDLYEAGFGEQIEDMVKELFAGKGAVRQTLHKYVSAR